MVNIKTFAQEYPGFTVKGLKFFRGREGHGYNMTLLKDGVKVMEVIEQGDGGEPYFDFFNGGEKIMKDLVEERRLLIPADKTSFDGSYNDREMFDLGILVEEMSIRMETEQKLRRTMKKRTVFRTPQQDDRATCSINMEWSPEAKRWVEKNHPGSVIFNEVWGECGLCSKGGRAAQVCAQNGPGPTGPYCCTREPFHLGDCVVCSKDKHSSVTWKSRCKECAEAKLMGATPVNYAPDGHISIHTRAGISVACSADGRAMNGGKPWKR